MPSIETYRKQAKLLVRWHRDGNYSIGGKLRTLERFREITDRAALDMAMPLALAQEIVAVEAGFGDWAALKRQASGPSAAAPVRNEAPVLRSAIPILFVRDVAAAARFYAERLGFAVDFLHGNPPFYGSVSRGGACLHLRFVHAPNFTELAQREGGLILATIEVANLKGLYVEYKAAEVDFAQGMVKQAWGGTDFHVRDPDGNVVSFVQYRRDS